MSFNWELLVGGILVGYHLLLLACFVVLYVAKTIKDPEADKYIDYMTIERSVDKIGYFYLLLAALSTVLQAKYLLYSFLLSIALTIITAIVANKARNLKHDSD